MKRKLLFILLFLMATPGCVPVDQSKMPPKKGIERLQYNSQAENRISVISSSTVIKRGYNGRLSIRGKPVTSYTIIATYQEGNRILTSRRTGTTDKNGLLEWSWRVGKKTSPGTYPLIITGGGDTYSTYYTVTR